MNELDFLATFFATLLGVVFGISMGFRSDGSFWLALGIITLSAGAGLVHATGIMVEFFAYWPDGLSAGITHEDVTLQTNILRLAIFTPAAIISLVGFRKWMINKKRKRTQT